MTNTSQPNSSSFRFLLIGGWTGVKSATLGSFLAVLVTLTFLFVYGIWQNESVASEFYGFRLQSFMSVVAFLLLAAILYSTVPAFVGGVILAWLLKRKTFKSSTTNPSKINIGAFIGLVLGILLTFLVLFPADIVGRTAHGGYGYNFLESLPFYVFYAVELIVISTVVGVWTDRQLRKYLENTSPKDTGYRLM
jgi:hypothetical protein